MIYKVEVKINGSILKGFIVIEMNRDDIELIFYKVIKNEISITEFEKWLYSVDEDIISNNFDEDFYFELISINYKNISAYNELEKIIYSKIPFNKYESMTLRFLLNSLINGTRDTVDLLVVFYNLYSKGYYFLRFLALTYISYGIDDLPKLSEKKLWDEASFFKKREILNELSPKIVSEAERILKFFDSNLIYIISEFEYEDLRKDEDKIELYNLEKMH